MKKLKMARGIALTFEEGCNKYLENCRQRNLREGTIEHYRQSYLYFCKFFDPKMPIEDIDEQTYKDYHFRLCPYDVSNLFLSKDFLKEGKSYSNVVDDKRNM